MKTDQLASKFVEKEKANTIKNVYPRFYVALPDVGECDITLSNDDSPVETSLAADLILFYGFDKGTHYDLVSGRDLKQLGLTIEQLHACSVQNLRDLQLDVRYHTLDGGVLQITAGGDHNAVVALLDEFYDALCGLVTGQMIVAIPSRYVLFICGDASVKDLEIMRARVSKELEHAEKPLSRNFVCKIDGRWTKYSGHCQ